MLERTPPQFRELHEITMQTDTRDILAHATRQAESHEDYFLVDIDAHVTETSFWPEILAMIDNDVIRHMGQMNAERPGTANASLLNNQPGILHQHAWGRIPHQQALMEKVDVVHDPAQESAPGEARKESARVIVVERGGKRHEVFVPYVVGFPSHPMSKADVEAKALELMTPRLGARRARAVVDQVWALDALKSGKQLVSLIAS